MLCSLAELNFPFTSQEIVVVFQMTFILRAALCRLVTCSSHFYPKRKKEGFALILVDFGYKSMPSFSLIKCQECSVDFTEHCLLIGKFMKVWRVEVIGKQNIVEAAKYGGSKSSLSKRMFKKTLLMGLLEQ
jgi:hypothetical protein